MEYTQVGHSGVSISRIGFGCAAMGGYDYGPVDDAQSVRAVYRALDCGITLFDVADVYGFGHAEEVLGKALKGVSVPAIVATKVGVRWDQVTRRTVRDVSDTYIAQAVEASLRRLQVERLDICQLHWPVAGVSPEETMQPLRRLQADGKIGLLGICNVTLPWLAAAQEKGHIDTLQLPCNIVERETLPTMLAAHRDHDMLTFAYNALAHGLLTGKFDKISSFPPTDLRNRIPIFQGARRDAGLRLVAVIREVAEKLGKTPAQVVIRWLLDREEVSCVLTGVKTAEQAETNARSAGWTLPEFARDHLSGVAELLCSSIIA